MPENADDKEIKSAYRQAALAYHPDHMPKGVSKRMRDDAAQTWLEIQEAFTVLSDSAKREEYDTLLEQMRQAEELERQFEPAATPTPAPQPEPPGNPRPQNQTPPAPPPSPPTPSPPAKRQSFWGPANTLFGSVTLITGGIGCLLLLGGLGDSQTTLLPGVTLISLSLALLCWRHGMRPGTDPKVLGGSVFLFIFTAIFFAGWIESPPANSKQIYPPSQIAATPAGPPIRSIPKVVPNIVPTTPKTQSSQPALIPNSVEDKQPIVATKDPASGRIIFSDEADATSNKPLALPKPITTPTTHKSWLSLRDSQTYRTHQDGDTLYIESTVPYPKRAGNIANCKFHRAISVGLIWAGECWEINPKDQSIYKSDATITTFSETRIDMGTGDLNPFTMIPADGPPNTAAQNSTSSLNQVQPLSPPTMPTSPPESAISVNRAARAQRDISALSGPERQSIESACSHAKYLEGPAEYNRCLRGQLAALGNGSSRPDLSVLSGPELQSIESACSHAKYLEGPASYDRCLRNQLTELANAPRRPDLSGLSGPEQQSIESACSHAKYLEGPASYNRCLRNQLTELANAPRRPDLSGLSGPEQQSIESACSHARYLEGPAAYNRCLKAQLDSLRNNR